MHINVLDHGRACSFSWPLVWLLLLCRGLIGEVTVGKQTNPLALKGPRKKVGYIIIANIASYWFQVGRIDPLLQV